MYVSQEIFHEEIAQVVGIDCFSEDLKYFEPVNSNSKKSIYTTTAKTTLFLLLAFTKKNVVNVINLV